MKYWVKAVFIIMLGVFLGGCAREKGPWYEEYDTICHALGRTEEGDTLTNSKEAFEYNYKRGQRVFEVDLSITSDNVMVCRHDWNSDLGQAAAFGWTEEEKTVPSAEQFLAAPIYEKYTPMTLADFYDIMKTHEDIYAVLDPKYTPDVPGQFSLIVNTAIENGCEEVLDRVIVQIYYKEMYDEVNSVYTFQNYLFTLYYIGYSEEYGAAAFCQEKGIPVITMPYTWYNDSIAKDLSQYDLKQFYHTVDEEADARRFIGLGCGIYTDDFLPGQFR